MNVNSTVIVGNLTRDPELKSLPSGTSVCELGVAVNEREKVNDEWQDRVNFFDVTCWGKQGEACANHLSKGSQVAVQGRLRYESWETDGQKRSKVKIVAQSVQFLGAKGDSEGSGGVDPSSEQASGAGLPF